MDLEQDLYLRRHRNPTQLGEVAVALSPQRTLYATLWRALP